MPKASLQPPHAAGAESGESTREALLDAAERLFAAEGLRASLRAITREAGANLAAVHYYFGSKEGLVHHVFARRLGPLNAERLRRLEASDGDLEAVLGALVGPVIELQGSDVAAFARLMGRAVTDPDGELRAVLEDEMAEIFARFGDALGTALPDLPRAVVEQRLLFSVGAMAHAVAAPRLFARSAPRPAETIDQLVAFLAGGFRAPRPASAPAPEEATP